MHFSKQSSGTIVSGFKNKIYWPEASFKAWLLAFANPIFCLFHVNFTVGKRFSKKRQLSSVELLSITIISPSSRLHRFKHRQKTLLQKIFNVIIYYNYGELQLSWLIS